MKTAVKTTLALGTILAVMAGCMMITALGLWMIFSAAAGAQQPGVHKDIVYARVDDTELKLDVVQPSKGDGPFPLVMWIHGGGWQFGDRRDHHDGMTNLAKRGYVGASIEYRFAPKHQYPAQLDDARAALAFLRKHSKDYKIDPDRVGVVGLSAGGQLALLLGMAKNTGKRNGVKCVVNFFGPTDFRRWTIPEEGEAFLRSALKKDLNGMLKDYLGTSDREARIMTEASPITYVGKDNPAILTIHGTVDTVVPFKQAELLHAALKKAKVPAKLFVVEGGGHGTFPPDKLTSALQTIADFLDKHLKDR